MKKLLFLILLLIAGASSFAQQIPPKPNPPKLVNDFTNTLSEDQKQSLEQKLYSYDDTTSNQVTVVIIESTKDYDIVDYATKLGREWGVGNKKTNNGVVLLVAVKDRKVFIAPGYGLEGAIPDITAKSIIDNSITPFFKEGNYYRGINQGTDDIIKAAAGEYKAPAGYNKKGKGSGGGSSLLGLIIIGFIIMMLAGRGGGRGGRGMMSRRGYSDIATGALLGSLLGGGRGGGGFGGGGFDGGSSGGGGFGGFGGGSFGGGGAGGSW